jgi:hypothetical protein
MRGIFKKMQMLKTIVICKENSRTAQKRIGKRERGEQKKKNFLKAHLHLAAHRKALNVTMIICNKIHHLVCMFSELFHIQGLTQP